MAVEALLSSALEARGFLERWKKEPWAEHLRGAAMLLTRGKGRGAAGLPRTKDGMVDLRGLAVSHLTGVGVKGLSAGLTSRAVWVKKAPDISGKKLSGVDLSYALLPHLEAHQAHLESVLFDRTNLFDMVAWSTRFEEVTFRNIDFYADFGEKAGKGRPVFASCRFEDDRFLAGELRDALVTETEFISTRFGQDSERGRSVSIRGTRFQNCVFRGCSFGRCIIGARGFMQSDGGFVDCRFEDCNIVDPSISGKLTLKGIVSAGNEVLVIPTGFRAVLGDALGGLGAQRHAERDWLTERIRAANTLETDSFLMTKEHLQLKEPHASNLWRLLAETQEGRRPDQAVDHGSGSRSATKRNSLGSGPKDTG